MSRAVKIISFGLVLALAGCQSRRERGVAEARQELRRFQAKILLARDGEQEAAMLRRFVSWARADRQPPMGMLIVARDPLRGEYVPNEKWTAHVGPAVVTVCLFEYTPGELVGEDAPVMVAAFPVRYPGSLGILQPLARQVVVQDG